jgi:hypothetical protein
MEMTTFSPIWSGNQLQKLPNSNLIAARLIEGGKLQRKTDAP